MTTIAIATIGIARIAPGMSPIAEPARTASSATTGEIEISRPWITGHEDQRLGLLDDGDEDDGQQRLRPATA